MSSKEVITYCVKEKKKTPTTNVKVVKTSNGRNRLTGICQSCGSKKSQFVGEGLLSLISKIPIVGKLLI